MNSGQTNRALRNKTNTMEIETEIENTLKTIQVKQEHTITKYDTEESLRQKFPNVNPYEFEFLLFLKAKSD